jgi:hypothetical protein
MLESESQVMFTAPEVGYTNVLAHQEQANPNRWSVATGDKRFYVQLRNGQLYGRIAFQIFADFHGKRTGNDSPLLRNQSLGFAYAPVKDGTSCDLWSSRCSAVDIVAVCLATWGRRN